MDYLQSLVAKISILAHIFGEICGLMAKKTLTYLTEAADQNS